MSPIGEEKTIPVKASSDVQAGAVAFLRFLEERTNPVLAAVGAKAVYRMMRVSIEAAAMAARKGYTLRWRTGEFLEPREPGNDDPANQRRVVTMRPVID